MTEIAPAVDLERDILARMDFPPVMTRPPAVMDERILRDGATDVLDDYVGMVKGLVERFYSGVTRYTTSSFLRAKLGEALERRAVAPYIFGSYEEASQYLKTLEAGATP